MPELNGSKLGVDVGIVMRNSRRMLQFYEDVLGLDHVEQIQIPWGTLHRFRFGESWVKLVDPRSDARELSSRGLDAASGIRYITFEITQISAVWQRAIDAGVDVFHELGPFGTSGITMGMLFDPDDNVVELLYRPPSAAVLAP